MTDKSRYSLHQRDHCRICGGSNLSLYLDLGDQPPSNDFIAPQDIANEQNFPLQVYICSDCGLSQLLHIVSAEDIFDDYLYLSSTSKALCQHYEGLVTGALERFRPDESSLMVDIGCNDGIMLKGYPQDRFRLLGIEPSSVGKHAIEAGFEVVSAFFNEETGKRLKKSHGGADIITATNVFAHVDDIRSFAKGVEALLSPDGVYIIEFPYLRDMIESMYFDTIYHEHLSYLALTPLKQLFAETGLRAFRVEKTEIGASGPALRLFVCGAESRHAVEESITALLTDEEDWGVKEVEIYADFAHRVSDVKKQILELVKDLTEKGHKVGAYCAPAKGNTLLNYAGLGPEDIIAVSDNNDLKVGKLTPGSHLPIISDQAFLDAGISHALLLAWNYLDFFLENADFIKQGGRFIVPLPEPKLLP